MPPAGPTGRCSASTAPSKLAATRAARRNDMAASGPPSDTARMDLIIADSPPRSTIGRAIKKRMAPWVQAETFVRRARPSGLRGFGQRHHRLADGVEVLAGPHRRGQHLVQRPAGGDRGGTPQQGRAHAALAEGHDPPGRSASRPAKARTCRAWRAGRRRAGRGRRARPPRRPLKIGGAGLAEHRLAVGPVVHHRDVARGGDLLHVVGLELAGDGDAVVEREQWRRTWTDLLHDDGVLGDLALADPVHDRQRQQHHP